MITVGIFLAIANTATAMDLQSFRSPSDNIHCMFITDDEGRSSVECELRSRTNTGPALPRPADCDLEWGSRFALDAKGIAGMVCHGDTLVDPSAPVVGYGEQLSAGGIACRSAETGMTCKNGKGRGFSLSRAKQTLF
jgi:hypothetical protein